MRAAVTTQSGIEVRELDVPVPAAGQVLVRTLACGICGSDLHAAADLAHFVELTERTGAPGGLDPERGAVFGHEFSAEIVEYGPATSGGLAIGTTVCSVPILFGAAGVEAIGYSSSVHGGLAEYMLLQEMFLLPVPAWLGPETAALTEPLAVGEHAVNLAGISAGDVCLVIGCGPVGLAVITALKARGHGPVIGVDFSPTRRRLAEAFGADEVIDPAETSPYDSWTALGVPATLLERAAAEMFGGESRGAVIFEAVGSPGVLQAIIEGAPPKARVVVVGVCMQTDRIEPFLAVAKELEVRFSFGYSPAEFSATLDRLSRGEVQTADFVTDIVPLDGAAGAFAALASPGEHGKMIVRH
ncbi:MAG: zinc-binding dehydrogenase [Acidimicrobiales bacterium]|jgi:threonine dehydrogenase-like Zn-dependent dehydrogenase